MNILIAGHRGFIGTNLTSYLVRAGHHVTGIDNCYTPSQTTTDAQFEYIQDVCELSNIDFSFNFDVIFNLACPASPPAYQRDPIFTLDTNYLGTKNLLNLARSMDSVLVQASTSEVYGNPLISPQSESYGGNVNTVGIRSCYDEGKRVAESLCFEYQRMGVNAKIARIFNTYGPHMRPDDGRVVSNFIIQALSDEPLTIQGSGLQTRSLCYISDLLVGLSALAFSDQIGPINLGNDTELTVLQIANTIIELTGSNSELIFKSLPQDDPLQRKPDLTLARSVLQYEPTVDYVTGLTETVAFFRNTL